jgi:hypothetical protein
VKSSINKKDRSNKFIPFRDIAMPSVQIRKEQYMKKLDDVNLLKNDLKL